MKRNTCQIIPECYPCGVCPSTNVDHDEYDKYFVDLRSDEERDSCPESTRVEVSYQQNNNNNNQAPLNRGIYQIVVQNNNRPSKNGGAVQSVVTAARCRSGDLQNANKNHFQRSFRSALDQKTLVRSSSSNSRSGLTGDYDGNSSSKSANSRTSRLGRSRRAAVAPNGTKKPNLLASNRTSRRNHVRRAFRNVEDPSVIVPLRPL